MNITSVDTFQEIVVKNAVVVSLGLFINSINGMLVFTFFVNPIFSRDSRYILYIHLVINDMIMILVSVILHVMSYTARQVNASFCFILLILVTTAFMISPLNLAGMAIERFIAVCKPLHHHQICTPQRTYVFICFLWCIGLIPSLADIFILLSVQPSSFQRTDVFCYPRVVFSTKPHQDRLTYSQIIYMSLVWFTVIYTYYNVMFIARKASSGSSANKARNTILLHAVQLLLCMLSYLTPVLDSIFFFFFPEHRSKILTFTYLLTHIMPRLLSPLIYGVRDQKFVKKMKEQFTCKFCFLKIVPKNMTTQ